MKGDAGWRAPGLQISQRQPFLNSWSAPRTAPSSDELPFIPRLRTKVNAQLVYLLNVRAGSKLSDRAESSAPTLFGLPRRPQCRESLARGPEEPRTSGQAPVSAAVALLECWSRPQGQLPWKPPAGSLRGSVPGLSPTPTPPPPPRASLASPRHPASPRSPPYAPPPHPTPPPAVAQASCSLRDRPALQQARPPARPPARPRATVLWSLVESLLTSRHSAHGVGAEGRERDESEGGERARETRRESRRAADGDGRRRPLALAAPRGDPLGTWHPEDPRGPPPPPQGPLPGAGCAARALRRLAVTLGSGGTRRQPLAPVAESLNLEPPNCYFWAHGPTRIRRVPTGCSLVGGGTAYGPPNLGFPRRPHREAPPPGSASLARMPLELG
ncbi:uncharacterized protein LOC132657112 [Meriones unguiculatus]|uniref:uncharacterized protein LOC132657112 n=1 Tax=Meriones unguiculatus TaxID=10047 RepID=UPI00293E7B5A|nr:uncharacterized protein LOC132657112 [Meriones unguiculatus]